MTNPKLLQTIREGTLALILIVLLLYVSLPRFFDAQVSADASACQRDVNTVADGLRKGKLPDDIKKAGSELASSIGYTVKSDKMINRTHRINFYGITHPIFITWYEREFYEQKEFLGYIVWTYKSDYMEKKKSNFNLFFDSINAKKFKRIRNDTESGFQFDIDPANLYHPTNGLRSEGFIYKACLASELIPAASM